MSQSQLSVRHLHSIYEDETTFCRLLNLARHVFQPTATTAELEPSMHRKLWEENMARAKACISYAVNTVSPDPEQPIGLFFNFPRTEPDIGRELLHIWLAAVDPASSGMGVFPLLLTADKEHARRCGYGELTVCTYPGRFEKMYRILRANDWQEVSWPRENEKVLMKTSVGHEEAVLGQIE